MVTGKLKANETACKECTIEGNLYNNTQELVEKTIEHLNLNNARLCELRLKILRNIIDTKAFLRSKHTDRNEFYSALTERYFQKKWPDFF